MVQEIAPNWVRDGGGGCTAQTCRGREPAGDGEWRGHALIGAFQKDNSAWDSWRIREEKTEAGGCGAEGIQERPKPRTGHTVKQKPMRG